MAYVGDELPSSTPRQIQWNGHTGIAQYGHPDDKLIVLFYKRPVHNATRSENEGRPVYDDVDFVRIQQPGETHTIMERPVTPSDRVRFAARWQQYQQNAPQTFDGTPIDLLFPGRPSLAEMCKACNVHTIEQLANLSGSGQDTLGMGAQEWVNMAKRFIDSAKDGAAFHEMRRDLETEKSRGRVLEAQVRALSEQIKKLNPGLAAAASVLPPSPTFDVQMAQINATDAPKRGRPRKSNG